MTETKFESSRSKKIPFHVLGVILLFIIAILLLWINNIRSYQSHSPIFPTVQFEGEFRINDGPWQKIVPGKHIPSTRGDVTLRGIFHLYSPDGEYIEALQPDTPIAFFTDHIYVSVYENGELIANLDNENPIFGTSSCGQNWVAYTLVAEQTSPVEIVIHNPHKFGNSTAVDEFIANFSLWVGLDFERNIIEAGNAHRDTGLLFIIVSFVLLGTAIFSSLLHIKNSRLIWMLGLGILFAGVYFSYGAVGVSFWNESITSNTTILGMSMMFYMLLLLCIITNYLNITKKLGSAIITVLGAAIAVCFIIPMVSEIRFYDTWILWIIVQTAANIAFVCFLIRECISPMKKYFWIYIGALFPLIAFEIDAVATEFGAWRGGLVSRYVFIALFIVALVMVLRIIPHSVNATIKATELEAEKNALDAELAQSRISTMISQIRPHFIYNTLGSIELLCELDPKKAGTLVHNFAKYLRGNFGELDNPNPILMSREMEHVKHYISIENARFPNMSFTFEMISSDFRIPALSIQPLVENAIKHGLMKLETGGSVKVMSYETDSSYCVTVTDDGVGFDTGILLDDRQHLGIRNIRGRLEAMVNGTLEIESTIGVGTKVLIKIPKEKR